MLRLAIITGGSTGLGAALCEVYGDRQWTIIEFSRSAPHPFSMCVDLADPQGAARLFAQAFEQFIGMDCAEVVAFNNAAVLGPVGPVEHSAVDAIAAHIDTNVLSGMLFARAFVEAFQAQACPKTFVNITSGAASHEYAGWSLYGASKAALNSFVRAVALEQSARPHPIKAINVNPGVMDTAMQAEVRSASREDFPAVDRYLALKRDGRLASPRSVAVSIADLVSSRPEAGSLSAIQP